MKKYTIEEIRKYLNNSETLYQARHNLSEETIDKANNNKFIKRFKILEEHPFIEYSSKYDENGLIKTSKLTE